MKWFAALLATLAFNAHAIDFSDQKGRDLSGGGLTGKSVETLTAGAGNKKGFRIETSVTTQGDDVGGVGLNVEAPLFNGTHVKVRALTGMTSDPFDFSETRFRLGLEFEYEVKTGKSFVFSVANRYDPFTKSFSTRPTVMAGARFYF